MQQHVFDTIDDPNLKGYVVWLPNYPRDSEAVARRSVRFLSDPRVAHLWDPAGLLGKTFGTLVTLPRGKTFAWDIYFEFDSGRTWTAPAPQPDGWMHQLGDDERRLDGPALATSLRRRLERR